jgi:hypothetical protein
MNFFDLRYGREQVRGSEGKTYDKAEYISSKHVENCYDKDTKELERQKCRQEVAEKK